MNTADRLEIYMRPITGPRLDGNGRFRITPKQRRRLKKKMWRDPVLAPGIPA